MVRLSGLEPETSRLSGGCSNQLSYKRSRSPRLCGAGLVGRAHASSCLSVSMSAAGAIDALADQEP